MSTITSNTVIEISTKEIYYDKKNKVISIELPDITFIGHYNKSTKLKKLLDDIYSSMKDSGMNRENIRIIDPESHQTLSESLSIKDLFFEGAVQSLKKPSEGEQAISSKEDDQKAKRKKQEAKSRKTADREPIRPKPPSQPQPLKSSQEEVEFDVTTIEEEEGEFVPPPPGTAPSAPPSGAGPSRSEVKRSEESVLLRDELVSNLTKERNEEGVGVKVKGTDSPITYEINMGFQYYSVMMEQKSYLFYIYFSHKKLMIMDEEGKTVYETTVTITTTKKEPPILDLRIEGDGFEVHPLSGKVEVKKDAVNPPLMIFSISPLKNEHRTQAEKKMGERRFLNIYIVFEGKAISHTVLSVIVQLKHFHLNLGPFQIEISKTMAYSISFLSFAIAVISVIYSIFSFESSSSSVEIIGGLSPSIATFIFIISYALSIVKGFRPLKQKWSKFLNFDKSGTIEK